jgi:alpha-L-rhamnosidase
MLAATVTVESMKVNNLEAPMGIDRTPVFSWKLSATERGVTQSAYQIVVSQTDGTTLWDTGKVDGDTQSSIDYAGPALSSSTTYNWKVKVWDQDGTASQWSTSSTFETALLNTSDWKAKWISFSRPVAQYTVVPAQTLTTRYIRLNATKLGLSVSGESGSYRIQLAEIEVFSSGTNVAKGCTATITPEQTYYTMWQATNLTDGVTNSTSELGGTTTAYTTATPATAPYIIIDLGKNYTVDKVILYPRIDTPALSNSTLCANFPVDFTLSGKADGATNYTTFYTATNTPTPAYPKTNEVPVFGKNFTITKDVKRARAYASGLGDFDMRINGQKLTDNVLEPGETDYTKTVLYATYDITDKLVKGTNTALSFIGGALYNNPGNSKYSKFNRIYGPQRFIAQLQIDYTDGTSETIVTDDTWKVNTGATTFSSWYGGEDYNANLYLPEMFQAGYAVDSWPNADLCTVAAGTLRAQFYPPTKVMETWKATSVSSPASGVYVVDFGQNFAGQYEFTIQQTANTVIKLYPTERLTSTGVEDQSATGSPRYDTYTFRGDAAGETWGPHFMYHGFRYLVIYGLKSAPTADMFTAKRIRSAVTQTGSVETSNTLLNNIHKIIVRATESNLYNTLTDCPHREKLGWLEVPQLMFNSISYNFDMTPWWPKVSLDTKDAQYDNGYVPNVAPHHVTFSEYWDNDPSWGGSTILVPYRSYKFYGDKSGIESAYPTMVRLMDYYKTRTSDNLLDINTLGDWGCYDKNTTVRYTINCTYYALARAMEETAGVLGKTTDETTYRQLAETIRSAINSKYYVNGVYDAGTQADYAMALYYGIVENANRADCLSKLLATVESATYHITTGEVALKPLFMSLADGGHNDVIYKMANKTDIPSYGYFIQQGATTLPEFWDMAQSLNHCMMGHIEEWFFAGIGGIRNTSVGFRKMQIAPYFCDNLTSADVQTECGAGRIGVDWTKADNTISASFNVPVNTEAEIVLPLKKNALVTENGKEITIGNGICSISYQTDSVHIVVGSGVYNFAFPDPYYTPTDVLLLNEAEDYTPLSRTCNVQLKRSFTPGNWSTLCLPFRVAASDITTVFGSGAQVADFTGVSLADNGDVTLNFSTTNAKIDANTPCLIRLAQTADKYNQTYVTLTTANPMPLTFTSNTAATRQVTATMKGTYALIPSLDQGTYIISGNKFYQVNSAVSLKPFRAYFTLSTSAVGVKALNVQVDGQTTAILGINADTPTSPTDVFNLNGQLMSTPDHNAVPLPKGVYIAHGKKFVVK